jgi:hypothetical protein
MTIYSTVHMYNILNGLNTEYEIHLVIASNSSVLQGDQIVLFSPIGQLFTLDFLLKITEVAQLFG